MRSPGFDNQTGEPAVHITLDGTGARIFQQLTRENVGKRMAMVLVEKGKGEVVTAPVIRQEIGGGRVQISGRMTTTEAREVALLLRAGALAAPMEIVEERTVGPSLGAENIKRGFHATWIGFAALSLFIIVYYSLFGVVSVIALAVNLMLLVALLSMLQATLTLPGIAAIALTLGMAIDANVLINERIREELRGGTTPQAAIHAGYERAWATILDSNITTLIAGIALFMFGTGPVRGLRGGALPGDPHLHVQRGAGVPRHREPDLRPPPQARAAADRQRGLEQAGAQARLIHSAPALARLEDHGILPHPQRHRLHAVRDGVQHHLVGRVPAVGVLPRHARAASGRGVHRRNGDGAVLRAHGRRQRRALGAREDRPGRCDRAELRQLRQGADPAAGAPGRDRRPSSARR